MKQLPLVIVTALINLALILPVNSYAKEVNVYSARKEQLIKPLLNEFTRVTNIKVNLITSSADALLKKLELEGNNSPADILITTDAGRLHRAKVSNILQPAITPKIQKMVDSNLQDPEHTWLALTTRARVIVYAKDRVKPNELISYEKLADPKWHKRICVRSSNNIYNQSLVASMIFHNGKEVTLEWAKGLVNNFARKPKGGDKDQIKAVAAGQCDIAIVNTYYLGQMANSSDGSQRYASNKVSVFWPNQADRGAHVNVSGIAITRSAKNKNNAIKLIEFLLSDEAQYWYAEANNEYPVIASAGLSDTLKNWGDFKSDAINLSKLGLLNNDAVKIMDKAGWR